MLLALTLLFAFFATIYLFLAVYQIIFASKLSVMNRLELTAKGADAFYEVSLRKPMREELLSVLGMLGGLFARRSYYEQLQRRLIQAHIHLRAEELIGLSIVFAITAFLFPYMLAGSFVMSLLFSVVAYMLPGFYIKIKKAKRSKQLGEQLPEALGIIANGLRAGYSFPQAMDVVSREMLPPIGEEFARVIKENRLGKPMEDVLNDLVVRAEDEDIDIFVTALLIQKQVGGNLAEILNKIEHTIRERVRIKGEINTLTAQQKLSALIIVLLPFVVGFFLNIISPEYFSVLLSEDIGWILMGFAIVLQVIGIFVISKLIKIDI